MIRDLLSRPLRSVRLSVTDRCNLRCRYCMPAATYRWLANGDLLTFEETARVAAVLRTMGVTRVRVTGGEPLLRPALPQLVGALRALDFEDLSLTTNATRLEPLAPELKRAGLDRITVSIDTLRRERMREVTRRDQHRELRRGIAAAVAAGFDRIKFNAVVTRGVNDDELVDLILFAMEHGGTIRFIEYMDVGGALDWRPELVVSAEEMLERIAAVAGMPVPLTPADRHAPARQWQLPDGSVFGIVASMSAPFCRDCDRARVTADGRFFTCLYAESGLDLRSALRGGASDDDIALMIADAWSSRSDRGAELRAGLAERQPLVSLERLRRDPHLEMHVRGG